jgi:D-alanyl-D-alanine carboxypeptidase
VGPRPFQPATASTKVALGRRSIDPPIAEPKLTLDVVAMRGSYEGTFDAAKGEHVEGGGPARMLFWPAMFRMLTRLAVLAALPILVSWASAAPADGVAEQVRAELGKVATTHGPGAVVLIARGDQVVFRGARGLADVELGVPMKPDQVFRIASITKMFTAALVLKLAQQGRVSLDDPVSRYLPELAACGQATIRQLLSHTAGISDRPTEAQRGHWRPRTDTATQIAEIGARPLVFASGTDQKYSNSGFILLGAIVERVTGAPWYESLGSEILGPLRLEHTRYGGTDELVPGRVIGYSTDNPSHAVRTVMMGSLTFPAAAGGLLSTAADLARWMKALAKGEAVGHDGFAAMTTPTEVPNRTPDHPYGLGTYVWSVRGAKMVGHTGQIDGFASALAYLPSVDVRIVVLANDDHFDARVLARRLAAISLGQPYPAVTPVRLGEPAMQALVGAYRVDATTTERISLVGARLYARRGARDPLPLQPAADGTLHFDPDELSYFRPRTDAGGAVIGLDYFRDGEGEPSSYPRVEPPSP